MNKKTLTETVNLFDQLPKREKEKINEVVIDLKYLEKCQKKLSSIKEQEDFCEDFFNTLVNHGTNKKETEGAKLAKTTLAIAWYIQRKEKAKTK